MAVEVFIAGRYLKAKRKEGFISLISFLAMAGVALGVMALIVVIAVMNGAESQFRQRILGLEPHILIMSRAGHFSRYQPLVQRLRVIPGVTAVSPVLFGQAMIRTKHAFSGAMIRGVEPGTGASMIKGFTPDELQRALAMQGQKDHNTPAIAGIVLGKDLARSLRVVFPDKIMLMSPNGLISPIGQLPSMKRFMVTATFDSGMAEYDGIIAYMDLAQAQVLMGVKDQISAVGIWVKDVFAVKEIQKKYLGFLSHPLYARDWMDINHSLFSALKLEKTAMFIILTLIILVAAFNIAGSLVMMVMEKTRDIAVLKAMGATASMIRNIFIIQGMVIGTLGTVLGSVCGSIVCSLLKKYDFIQLPAAYPFSTLPVQLEISDVWITAVSALVICFLSTLYPSWKAAGMNPSEAMRYA